MNDESFYKGPIAWMARNPVAANLLMIFFVAGGLFVAGKIKKEIYPAFEVDIVRVTVDYPGASPEQVEEGILLSIEDEVRSLDSVKRVTSHAFEGQGVVSIELLEGTNKISALQNVKNLIDSIQSFPEEAERPIINLVDKRRQVITLIVKGRRDKRLLKEIAENIRDELIQDEGVTLVEIQGVPALEISIEVPTEDLRAYGLKLNQIAGIVRSNALDLPGGGIKTPSGEMLLRTTERRDFAEEFGEIPVVAKKDGTRVLLSDIAEIEEKFEDTDEEAFFNGMPAVYLEVFRVGDQSPLDIAESVRRYVEKKREALPDTIDLVILNDRSEIYRDRISLLRKNAFLGLILVLIFLGLFLEPALAFWVTIGIPVSIIGSFIFIPLTEATINMTSLFAFIITLGIIVDDAVLVGENIYHKREKGIPYLKAAIWGAREMALPVTFAVMTNIVAFLPLLLITGPIGKIFRQIPSVVIVVFIISLVESLFILPAHLTRKYPIKGVWKWLNKPNEVFEKMLKWYTSNVFIKQLGSAMRWRYLTVTSAICILVVVISFIAGGHLKFIFLPKIDSDVATVQVILPFGVPLEVSRQVQQQLVEGAERALEKSGGKQISKGMYTQIGSPIPGRGPLSPSVMMTGTHIVGMQLFLVPADEREISGVDFANLWREEVGEIVEAESSTFQGIIQITGGHQIDLHLSHPDQKKLDAAAKELAMAIRSYEGTYGVDDGIARGKQQFSFQLRPQARVLGITSEDFAEQIRGSFYGIEALRQQRGRDEMKVMVRLPEDEREKVETVDELLLRTPKGGEIPISEAADIEYEYAYTDITRTNGRRVQAVSADVDESRTNSLEVVGGILNDVIPNLIEKYPGLTYTIEGKQRNENETLEDLGKGFLIALVGIYTLLAIPFRSYVQPLIVMMSIPFGIIGAVFGHILLGYHLSFMSLYGIMALSGVVVNDSLVLIVTANENMNKGMKAMRAIMQAGKRRFRPIILTSFTTFFGLAPMMLETSIQARFLIPMAISLGFGILFATFIILLVTTSFYLILDDLKTFFRKKVKTP